MAHQTFFKSNAAFVTRSQSKATKAAQTLKDRRDVYKLVDERDEGRCRFCGVKTIANGGLRMQARHHHHIRGRRGKNAETTGNIIVLCRHHHEAKHVTGQLQVSGNADGMLTFALGALATYRSFPPNPRVKPRKRKAGERDEHPV